MAVDPRIALSNVRRELDECKDVAELYGWEISYINEKAQLFHVQMISPIDDEKYIMEIKFDNYKSIPLLIEFIDPKSNKRGIRRAYPKSQDYAGRFFHGHPCICHPCSRKAYKSEAGLHPKWSLGGWRQNPRVGTLTSIKAILLAIYFRISNEGLYGGRMSG